MKKKFDFNKDRENCFFLIAGPCVIESEELNFETARKLKEITERLSIPFIFKSSLYKANRTSKNSFSGIGYSKGLEILNKIKSELDLMILTDVHEDSPLDEIADVVDIFQTPAFLCRQTNFIQNVVSHNIPVNIKKGQFLSPWEMSSVVEKAKATGNKDIMVCERGFSFGYNNLISDMRSLVIMRDTNCPVVFDATHSTQLPGLNKDSSSGQSQFIAPLARAAISVGISGIFMETHPNPEEALCDGMNSLPLDSIEKLLITLKNIDDVSKE
ncbi:MAG: 3-deoxy-8-phosphooctulonate synthase [Gammaproteobacteria bacterium]|jgi:2-dehydro-3-deoxyphosphooctonate aldolase (KDO 8-P synthase)|nr:3-deoxy-8-phosphooctulonate synthase [Gammaproteobacteria bacterium]MBT7523976.1 3-deoxy-8-phosphooctulonate synthase [Gammaproteobacteria bacterium]MBT7814913.1 3-deoxy-8-phosphooctulonate synthase [Gammaproteobacteria bacterium]|tara:strand:- start:195 stop:1007 length:813 start_codon:yes stop_codon:yes gene_type:complete